MLQFWEFMKFYFKIFNFEANILVKYNIAKQYNVMNFPIKWKKKPLLLFYSGKEICVYGDSGTYAICFFASSVLLVIK